MKSKVKLQDTITVYTIFDNRTRTFWQHKAKAFWVSKTAAKNALVGQKGGWLSESKVASFYNEEEFTLEYRNRTIPHCIGHKTMAFKDQTRFICLKMQLTRDKGLPV